MASFQRVVLLVIVVLTWHSSISQVSALRAREVNRASTSISQRPEYQAFHDYIDDYLKKQIPLTDITILLPLNIATIRGYTKDQQTTIISYNTIATRYLFRNLTDIPPGTQLDTLEGNLVAKRGPKGQPVVTFQGAAQLQTALLVPNMWIGSDFTIHGTSTLLIPPDLVAGSAASVSSRRGGIIGAMGGAVRNTVRGTMGGVTGNIRGAARNPLSKPYGP